MNQASYHSSLLSLSISLSSSFCLSFFISLAFPHCCIAMDFDIWGYFFIHCDFAQDEFLIWVYKGGFCICPVVGIPSRLRKNMKKNWAHRHSVFTVYILFIFTFAVIHFFNFLAFWHQPSKQNLTFIFTAPPSHLFLLTASAHGPTPYTTYLGSFLIHSCFIFCVIYFCLAYSCIALLVFCWHWLPGEKGLRRVSPPRKSFPWLSRILFTLLVVLKS